MEREENEAKYNRKIPLYLFFVALVLRLVALTESLDNPFLLAPVLDESFYISIARSIAGGNIFGGAELAYLDPLYPYLLSLSFYLFGDNLIVVRIFQIATDSAVVIPIFMLARRFSGNNIAAILAGLLWALYLPAIFYPIAILKTTLFSAASLFFVYLLVERDQSLSGGKIFAFGIFAGFLALLRSNAVLYVPLIAMVLFISHGRKAGRTALIMFAGLALVLSLNCARNLLVTGEAIFLTSQSGRLFYASNNPENLSGRYKVPSFSRAHPKDSETDFHKEAEKRTGRKMGIKEVSQFWRNKTFNFLFSDMGTTGKLVTNKLNATIGNFEIPTNVSMATMKMFAPVFGLPLVNFAIIFAFGLPGLFFILLKNSKALYLLLPLITTLVTIILFYSSSRLRFPIVPILAIGSAGTIGYFFELYNKKDFSRILGLFLVVSMIFATSMAQPIRYDKQNETHLLAKAYIDSGDFAKGGRLCAESLSRYKNDERFYVLLSIIAIRQEQYDKAIEMVGRAIKIDDKNANAWHNLGVAYIGMGRAAEAVKSLKKAKALGDTAPETDRALKKASSMLHHHAR